MKKRLISLLLTLAMVAGLFFQWALAAEREIDVGSDDSFDKISKIANKG